MNPPFSVNTESSAKFGSDGQKAMRNREDAIASVIADQDPLAGKALSRKTIAPFFTVLSDYLLDNDHGVLAKVIPWAACVNAESAGERRFLADRFEVSIVVTSHDPSHLGFSENTSIHECLVVCRRKPIADRDDTLFVSLSRMPNTVDEAIEATEDILAGGTSQWIRSARWPKELVKRGDWSPTQWVDFRLAKCAQKLSSHSRLKPLGDMAHFGPAHVRNDLKNPASDSSDGPYRVLWRHQTGKMRTMAATWDGEVAAKSGSEKRARVTLWPQASRLLIGNKLQTGATRVASVLLDKPALGSQWTPISPIIVTDRKLSLELQKAWCVWLNSTPGILGFLHRRGRKLTYSDFMPKILQSLPCPDPRTSDVRRLADTYDEVRLMPLQPWNSMVECPVRTELDNAVANAIGMDRHEIRDIRIAIMHEPTVSGKRMLDTDEQISQECE